MQIVIRDVTGYPEMIPRYGWVMEWTSKEDEDRFDMLIEEPTRFATVAEAKVEAHIFKNRVSNAEIIDET